MSRVTVAEAKSWSKIYFAEEDAIVQTLIDAAEEHVADFVGRDNLDDFAIPAPIDSPPAPDSPASETLTAKVKVVVLQVFDELYQNRGVTVVGTIQTEGPMWQRIAHFCRIGLGV